MNEPIRHEIELGEDVPLIPWHYMAEESDTLNNLKTLNDILVKSFGDKNYLLIQFHRKFFDEFLADNYTLRHDNLDWMIFLSSIDNLIIYEFRSKHEFKNACYDFYREIRNKCLFIRNRNEQGNNDRGTT